MNPHDYGYGCSRTHASVSSSFREAKQKFLADVEAMIPNLSDEELRGSGNLRNLSIVQPLIKAELQKRRERVVWSVREGIDLTTHDSGYIVTNTSNRDWTDKPANSFVARSSVDTLAQAVAGVAGYSVEEVGKVGESTLFIGTKEA